MKIIYQKKSKKKDSSELFKKTLRKFKYWHKNVQLFGIRKEITDEYTLRIFTEISEEKARLSLTEQKMLDKEIEPFKIPTILSIEAITLQLPSHEATENS